MTRKPPVKGAFAFGPDVRKRLEEDTRMALLTPTEAAKAVGKARSTIYMFENNGMLASTKDPATGRKMFDTDELLRVFKRFVNDGDSGSATAETSEDTALEHAREAADSARV